MPQSKRCTTCNKLKGFDEFRKSKGGKHGTRSTCRDCERKRSREYYRKNKAERKKYAKKYYRENKVIIAQKSKKKYDKETEGKKRKKAAWRRFRETRDILNQRKHCSKCNKYQPFDKFYKRQNAGLYGLSSQCRECKKEYREVNKERAKKYLRKYRKNNRKEIYERRNEWRNDRFESDQSFKLKYNLSSRIRIALKKESKSHALEVLLGCDIEEVKEHLGH